MSGRAILVAAVGRASGSKAAAAALACAGSDPDRPGLLVDVDGQVPRPTLIASSGARELEERLVIHTPQLRVASRGQTCHLSVSSEEDALELVRAALPLVRDAVAAIHLPPPRLQSMLNEREIRFTGAMLRADLGSDRALTALAVRNLLDHDLRVRVLKRPLAWVPARRALFGALPRDSAGGLPAPLVEALVEGSGRRRPLPR